MDRFDSVKKNQYQTMFFTLKMLASFFAVTPLFQYLFNGTTTSNFFPTINLFAALIALGIVMVIIFLWLIMDYDRQKLKFMLYLEIIVFYAICLSSICLSGAYASYYKFLFIFMIVSYTIEFGIKVGLTIAITSSLTLLALDLFLYGNKDVNTYFQSDLALSAMFIVVAWILGFYVKMEQKHIRELKEFANIDGLTEIYNHRYFHEIFKIKCDECIEKNVPISLIMLDIDYFKIYNDMYGHQQGDQVLREISAILKGNVRKNDIVCRYGGEEFCVILPGINQEETNKIANNLREMIYSYQFEGMMHMPNSHITVSLGISELYGANDNIKNIVSRADDALYRAKFFRKNRVEIYSSIFDDFSKVDKENSTIDENIKSVKSLISIINSRDRYTYNHIERVVYYCQIFAESINLSQDDKKKLIYGAYLHDLGKINVSKEILISENKLTKDEWEEMKRHPSESADIIRQIGGMESIAQLVVQHHEKYDGSGYPKGIQGEDINYLSRMLTIADSFDAMTNKRPYQEKKTFEEAFCEIERCKGTHFDPDLSDKFIEAIKNMQ